MSTEIHPVAQAGWSGRGAVDYEQGRPGYPPAAVALIGAELSVGPGTTILDLAAGTGKLTRELPMLGARVIAVEPIAAMRAQLADAAPDAEVLTGSAEAIPVDDGSVRAVTVAQAFHWFDVRPAAAEIARVLDGAGGLAIIRNEWLARDTMPWSGALREFIHTRARLETHTRDWRSELDATRIFEPFRERAVDNEQFSDIEGLCSRVASMSFIAALDDAARGELVAQARALLRDHGVPAGESIAVPTRTVVRWARLRGGRR